MKLVTNASMYVPLLIWSTWIGFAVTHNQMLSSGSGSFNTEDQKFVLLYPSCMATLLYFFSHFVEMLTL